MYDWLYRRGLTPWIAAGRAQGALVAELLAAEEARHGPGATLVDLGCGSGEHTLTAARRGWRVTGVDASVTAIRRARAAAAAAGLPARFVVGDVRRLPEVGGLPREADLFVDVGCYHGFRPADRAMIAAGIGRLAAPAASLIVVGLDRSPGRAGVGVTAAGLADDFPRWRIEPGPAFELGVRGPLRRACFRVFTLTREDA